MLDQFFFLLSIHNKRVTYFTKLLFKTGQIKIDTDEENNPGGINGSSEDSESDAYAGVLE